jgi:hypothetical protein
MLTLAFVSFCSREHDSDFSPKTLAIPNPFTATQATHAGPATGTEFMAEAPLKPLRAILETIREQANYALKQLQDVEEQRSMRWKCKDCEYVKHFTRPVSLEAAGRCPRCKITSFAVTDAVDRAAQCRPRRPTASRKERLGTWVTFRLKSGKPVANNISFMQP